MSQSDPQAVSTSDRRRETREPSSDRVSITIETPELDGQASNVSKSGILFFTDDDVKVQVTLIDAEGQERTVAGHLVRCERIKGNHRGWAVEFDRS